MSITFSANQTHIIHLIETDRSYQESEGYSLCLEALLTVPPDENLEECVLLASRAYGRFRAEMDHYLCSKKEGRHSGLLPEVRKYHRLLVDALSVFELAN